MANLDLGYDSKDTVNREWEEEETLQVYIPCQQKNEFNEDDDWFDRPYRSLNYTHAVIKEKLNFLFFEIDVISDTLLKSKILIIRVKEQLGTAVSCPFCSLKKHVYLEPSQPSMADPSSYNVECGRNLGR